ncbi:MATE family efflux transporter [Clostridium formicaceticum]|uniref:Probable multidrug resistance protein NorM n=1 Tax=Clostridium formicaceticum TaxID=1497 RepID=A0AAC9RKE1_9CLOT|nr:MATE family efflux transporter [Clostridium formicaceticum]AOY74500.1 MATE family efflux transporter [Clostridium formicaceticum]ARE88851.1 Multidrug export protein MepA [Clostridium formicaceticum]
METKLNEKDKQKQMILSENLWKVMYSISWPAVIAMVLYGLNSVFDAIFVGRFVGETALAGVSIAYPLSQITLGLGSLIGVGAGSALSIALGAKDKETQKKILGNVNYLAIVVTVIYVILALLLTTPLVKVMGGVGDALEIGRTYFQITVIGALFWIYGLAGNMIVRAEGKMKTAALIMALGLMVNITANYILIVVMDMGVAGAAWGTNLGMFVYTAAGFIYFAKGKASFEAHSFKFFRDKKMIKDIFSMGMPSLIMSVMSLVQAVVVFNALSRYGSTYDLALYGAIYRIFTLLLTPIFGLMRALQPVIGINYGAKNNLRVISSFKIFAIASTLMMLPFWIITMLVPEAVLGLMFTNKIFDATSLLYFRTYMALLSILPVIFMMMTFYPAINTRKTSRNNRYCTTIDFLYTCNVIESNFYL